MLVEKDVKIQKDAEKRQQYFKRLLEESDKKITFIDFLIKRKI